MGDEEQSVQEVIKLPKKFEMIQRFWKAFHNLVIAGLVFTLIGVAIGIKVSKDFYVCKLDEVIATGAMLHKAKVYTINLKL